MGTIPPPMMDYDQFYTEQKRQLEMDRLELLERIGQAAKNAAAAITDQQQPPSSHQRKSRRDSEIPRKRSSHEDEHKAVCDQI